MANACKDRYEYDAPQYVDFKTPTDDDKSAEDYFNVVHHEHEENHEYEQQSVMDDTSRFDDSYKSIVSYANDNQENLDPALSSIGRRKRQKDFCDEHLSRVKQRLTIPKTPLVLKRCQELRAMKRNMTDEEFEENQKREAKMKFAHKRVVAAKDRKLANILKKQTISKPDKKLLQTDDLRLKSGSDAKTLAEKGIDFVSELRKHTETYNFSGKTEVVPFVFHGNSKESCANNQKVETLAEKCNKFVTKTPTRFHYKSVNELQKEKLVLYAKEAKRPKRTIPKTPKLLTKSRARPVDIPSQEEREKAEYEEMMKNQFKATKLNKNIFLNKKIVPKANLNKIETAAKQDNHKKLDETLASVTDEEYKFHARPVPLKILAGPVGIKPRQKIPTTEAKSPEFSELHATKKFQALLNDTNTSTVEFQKNFPVPSVSQFKPHLEHRHIESAPFSFESRDKEMLEKKEQKIKAVYEMEKEARKFVANPLPEFVPNLPAKKSKPATMIEEFVLETDKRAAIQHEKWQKLLEEEMLRDKECRMFKAKPAFVLNNEPFVPELQHNSSTLCLHGLTNEERRVPTNLEKRAAEWQQRNKLLLKHQEEIERQALENQKIRMEEEEREVRKMRDQMVHQAQPIKSGKPLKIEPSSKPVTEPKSPNFSKRLTARFEHKSSNH